MIRILVVDDSSFMRRSLTYILQSDPSVQVISTAVNGTEAVEQVKKIHPNVVLLDIEMPVMDGLSALAHIMAEAPTPTVMISGLGKNEATLALECLEAGAIDFIAKPSGVISYDIDKIRQEIIAKVKVAATVDVRKIKFEAPAVRYLKYAYPLARKKVVILGASTGGPRALTRVLSGLTSNLAAAVIVIQHLGAEFMPFFVERLQWHCSLDVTLAKNGQTLEQGQVLVAPAEHYLTISSEFGRDQIRFKRKLKTGALTSIDEAMKSAARIYGPGVLGVLLTGAGIDGALGIKAIKQAGGSTIAEAESTCVVFGMPQAAIKLGGVDEVLPLPAIAPAILKLAGLRDKNVKKPA